MAGAQTVFSVLFEIQAKLNGNFNNSFTNAQNAARKLQNELSGINAAQNKIGGYQKQAQALDKNREKLTALTEEQERLRREMSQTEQPSEALKRAYDQNANQIAETTARIAEQERQLNALGDELREAGIDTDNLTGENDRLAQSYERVQRNQERLSHIADAQQKNAAAISATKAQLVGTVGAISAVGAAIYAGPVKNACGGTRNLRIRDNRGHHGIWAVFIPFFDGLCRFSELLGRDGGAVSQISCPKIQGHFIWVKCAIFLGL